MSPEDSNQPTFAYLDDKAKSEVFGYRILVIAVGASRYQIHQITDFHDVSNALG
tara:strand:+ start:224 stop:385 length:162 start_codon:yes stop_codon:yes gene_type:complete